MTELAKIVIASPEGIVEFRNKFLVLLRDLLFPEMESVRIVTKISDFIRAILQKEKSLQVKIQFEKTEKYYDLVLIVNSEGSSIDLLKEKSLFLNSQFAESRRGVEAQFSFPILNKTFYLDSDYLLKLREKIIVQSKAELMSEIKRKNEELNTLLDDLKKSAGLIQSEKMRALGVLTAGVAHELNNPMMGILNFIQYSLKKTDPEDKRYEALQDAEHETKRCIDIVRNLLTFSHLEKDEVDFKPVNIAIIIDRVLKILTFRLRNEKIKVEQENGEKILPILGHENRLQQAILNLVTNAMDAMKNSENKILHLSINTDGARVKLGISDTGEGMDEETQKKIFEPFFTTKPTGSGTGLGLSVCESIIKEHKGNLVCHSQKHKGTQFIISLPTHNEE